MTALERQCTLLVHADEEQAFQAAEILDLLQAKEVDKKMDGLKRVIRLQLNGQPVQNALMTVIRFILPHEDTHLRKLGLYFLETVDKVDASGKQLPEMLLVINMIRNELLHSNEYTRGCALRFCCKVNIAEMLEPLVEPIRENLQHRHSFVRRNAVLAIQSVFSSFEYLIPDAPELIEQLLDNDDDLACKRNAFAMLIQCDPERAVSYIQDNVQEVPTWQDTMQLAALDLIRKVCRTNPMEKGKYIKVIFSLLGSSSAAMVYEAANTLISLSSAPTAIRAAGQSYCQLLTAQSDNNVKLILLDRLIELKKSHKPVMQELLMEMMRVLSSPNMDLRVKLLNLAMELITSRNVEEVVSMFNKELLRTQSSSSSDDASNLLDYRRQLIRCVHESSMRFPDVAGSAVNVLGDFLGDMYGAAAADVVTFAREAAETFEKLRPDILKKLLFALPSLHNSNVVRGALWILGEYSSEPGSMKDAFQAIMEGVGRMPLAPASSASVDTESVETAQAALPKTTKKPQILADGTYATQAAFDESPPVPINQVKGPGLRTLLLAGDYFVGAAVCTSLTKLVLRLAATPGLPQELLNKVKAEAMLVCASLLRFGRSEMAPLKIDEGTGERLVACIHTLSGNLDPDIWLVSNRSAFQQMIQSKRDKEKKAAEEKAKDEQVQPGELIDFAILRARRLGTSSAEGAVDEMELARGMVSSKASGGFDLNRIVQLTGMSDPVYAEAQLVVHQYDIILDVVVTNKTSDTLQNLTLELATMGDLRLCERPQSYMFGPNERKNICANIKVSSTETGIIFGNIVYDISGSGAQTSCIILNDIHIDVMDYIKPGDVEDVAFRSMWAEFEWENKVAINTVMTDLSEYLDFIVQCTNMNCITLRGIEKESGFLAANLYATSVFNEDALVNVSAEKTKEGQLQGFIRIRSKTQGIALSLGDKITLKQAQKKGTKA
mmetsp:Transcript_2857/g.5326  ORF Transcript_2857/g.5326 Transcript_2857/m.5326 type:complete len:949 (-) Transcript_2857:1874-4720(-)